MEQFEKVCKGLECCEKDMKLCYGETVCEYKSEYETEDGREITYAMCPDCLNSFKKWIKSGRVTNGTDNP